MSETARAAVEPLPPGETGIELTDASVAFERLAAKFESMTGRPRVRISARDIRAERQGRFLVFTVQLPKPLRPQETKPDTEATVRIDQDDWALLVAIGNAAMAREGER